METYSKKYKEVNIKRTESTMSWADVARNSESVTRSDKSVKSDACTCHVFQQIKDDRQRLHADRTVSDSKSGANKGHFLKSKKNVSKTNKPLL